MHEESPPVGRPPPLAWTEAGAPRSAVFDDIYFQPGEGLAEARAVFLDGCGLPQAWSGRRRFVVAELGFGTGLNILALLDLWRRTRSAGQQLQVFTVEAYPLAAQEARRALAAFPELADLAGALLARWPRQARGWHRIELPALGAVIDLAISDAAEALAAWTGRADAWFLDGFSPAANPAMWSQEVLALVAARSAPGARLGTFTVAGHVRRALAAQGFAVERVPGHGRKRQRLEARAPGTADDAAPPGRVAVVGGGIAAAALCRALSALGVRTVQVHPGDPGASGNPAALVTPGLDAGEGAMGRLYAQALHRAADLYGSVEGAVVARGVLQLEREPRDGPRFDRIAAGGLFAPGALRRLDSAEAAARLGEPPGAGGLLMEEALVVEPARILDAWRCADVAAGAVASLEVAPDGWRLKDAGGAVLLTADAVCLAAGAGLRALLGRDLQVVRGQASWSPAATPGTAAAWGGYAAPLPGTGVLFGATHDRGDENLSPRPADDARNLAELGRGRPRLADALAGKPLASRVGLRLTTQDRLPLAGAAGPAGLFVLGGLGSRGFVSAPLLAEHVAALVAGAPSPLPADLILATEPER